MTGLRGPTDPGVIWSALENVTGKRAFDVGANVGAVARMLAKNFTWVVAFEPALESLIELVDDCPPNVIPANVAVTSKHGPVYLSESEQSIKTGQLVSPSEEMEWSWGPHLRRRLVGGITLDEATKSYGVPDFVKIDVEGHEVQVVEGGPALWERYAPRVLIEVHGAGFEEPLRALLPNYTLELVRHPGYSESHAGFRNHFFLRGEAAA